MNIGSSSRCAPGPRVTSSRIARAIIFSGLETVSVESEVAAPTNPARTHSPALRLSTMVKSSEVSASGNSGGRVGSLWCIRRMMKGAASRGWFFCDAPMSWPPEALHDWYPCLKKRAGADGASPVETSKIADVSRIGSAPRLATVARTTHPPNACSRRAEIARPSSTALDSRTPESAASSSARACPAASMKRSSIRDRNAFVTW